MYICMCSYALSFLRLTVSSSRTVLHLVQFLSLKWQLKHGDSEDSLQLFHTYSKWRSMGLSPSSVPTNHCDSVGNHGTLWHQTWTNLLTVFSQHICILVTAHQGFIWILHNSRCDCVPSACCWSTWHYILGGSWRFNSHRGDWFQDMLYCWAVVLCCMNHCMTPFCMLNEGEPISIGLQGVWWVE